LDSPWFPSLSPVLLSLSLSLSLSLPTILIQGPVIQALMIKFDPYHLLACITSPITKTISKGKKEEKGKEGGVFVGWVRLTT